MIKRDYEKMLTQLIKTDEFYDTAIQIQIKMNAEHIAEMERTRGSFQMQIIECKRKIKEL